MNLPTQIFLEKRENDLETQKQLLKDSFWAGALIFTYTISEKKIHWRITNSLKGFYFPNLKDFTFSQNKTEKHKSSTDLQKN